MRPIDLSKILVKYKRGWIALTPDNKKFIASAPSLKQVLKKANEKGTPNPTVFKATPVKHLFAG